MVILYHKAKVNKQRQQPSGDQVQNSDKLVKKRDSLGIKSRIIKRRKELKRQQEENIDQVPNPLHLKWKFTTKELENLKRKGTCTVHLK